MKRDYIMMQLRTEQALSVLPITKLNRGFGEGGGAGPFLGTFPSIFCNVEQSKAAEIRILYVKFISALEMKNTVG